MQIFRQNLDWGFSRESFPVTSLTTIHSVYFHAGNKKTPKYVFEKNRVKPQNPIM